MYLSAVHVVHPLIPIEFMSGLTSNSEPLHEVNEPYLPQFTSVHLWGFPRHMNFFDDHIQILLTIGIEGTHDYIPVLNAGYKIKYWSVSDPSRGHRKLLLDIEKSKLVSGAGCRMGGTPVICLRLLKRGSPTESRQS